MIAGSDLDGRIVCDLAVDQYLDLEERSDPVWVCFERSVEHVDRSVGSGCADRLEGHGMSRPHRRQVCCSIRNIFIS